VGIRYGGRKAGTPNKANIAARLRIEQEADPIGRLIEAANTGKVRIGGEETALSADQYLSVLRELRRVIVPDAKSRTLALALPPVSTAEDVSKALAVVFEAMAKGELAVDEAASMAEILESKRRAVELVDLERRLSALEAKDHGKSLAPA
jgi:hypothetical protein